MLFVFDTVALGESLIDLTFTGYNENGIALLARNPGGAPANCLAMHAKLGGRTAMIGMVGDDAFGRFLAEDMRAGGIDTRGVVLSGQYPTTLAVVQLDESGERCFSFYRDRSADIMLGWDDVDKALLDDCRIFHFGGVSLTGGPAAETTLAAARYARERGKLISYDPNYRPALWKSEAEAKTALLAAVPLCHFLKVNEDELLLLTGTDDPEAGGKMLLGMGPSLVAVTLGGDGAFYINRAACGRVGGFKVAVRDTTGAGDAFTGALHSRIRDMSPQTLAGLDGDALHGIVRYACAAGALTTTGLGAIPALPTAEEIDRLLCEQP